MRIDFRPFRATKTNLRAFFRSIKNDYDDYGGFKYVVFTYNRRTHIVSDFTLETRGGWKLGEEAEDCIIFQHELYDWDYKRTTIKEYMEAFDCLVFTDELERDELEKLEKELSK